MQKIKLNVLGISYSQTQSGAYALVLSEAGGERRIPIIIGGFEAQSIAIQLEGLTPPRPLTHDLFVNFANNFNVKLLEVLIYKLDEGVFYSKLLCSDGKVTHEIDARTSDAVSLALRFKSAVYTTEEILDRAGIVLDSEASASETPFDDDDDDEMMIEEGKKSSLADISLADLNNMLDEAIKEENYEFATKVRDEIERRKK
ncbi:MAG: bifunctional nuclease family protein [Bacteroidales bacterium]|nr:bifunctional nuclease family protein [Bacteroidales bacterium]